MSRSWRHLTAGLLVACAVGAGWAQSPPSTTGTTVEVTIPGKSFVAKGYFVDYVEVPGGRAIAQKIVTITILGAIAYQSVEADRIYPL